MKWNKIWFSYGHNFNPGYIKTHPLRIQEKKVIYRPFNGEFLLHLVVVRLNNSDLYGVYNSNTIYYKLTGKFYGNFVIGWLDTTVVMSGEWVGGDGGENKMLPDISTACQINPQRCHFMRWRRWPLFFVATIIVDNIKKITTTRKRLEEIIYC